MPDVNELTASEREGVRTLERTLRKVAVKLWDTHPNNPKNRSHYLGNVTYRACGVFGEETVYLVRCGADVLAVHSGGWFTAASWMVDTLKGDK